MAGVGESIETLPLGERREGLGALTLEKGQQIGRYQVLELIGSGAMGVVYSAFDPQLDRSVAIKILVQPKDQPSAGLVRLLREAKVLARLNHPNVVAIHDAGEFDGSCFIAMELVVGTTVKDWLRTQQPSLFAILEVFLAAGNGLAAAHDAGIVHRDFKPTNVMIGDDGRVRVMDFGLARDDMSRSSSRHTPLEASDLDDELTQEGTILGTPLYMAPEQHDGHRVTAKADQFSFCVALFCALYGEHPFTRPSRRYSVQDIREGVCRGPETNRSVPAKIHACLVRGLQLDPAKRWPNMRALMQALVGLRQPKSRRIGRRWAIASALAITPVVGYVVVERATVCERTPVGLRDAWNDEVRAGMLDRYSAMPQTYASVAGARAAEALDRYAQQWQTAYREACEADRSAPEHDVAARTTLNCLDQRTRELHSLVEVVADPDEQTPRRAVQAVAMLGAVGACQTVDALVAGPPDEYTAQRVEDLRAQLATATALLHVGRFKPALDRIEDLDARAERLGYVPLQAEIARQRWRAAKFAAQTDPQPYLERAYGLAIESNHRAEATHAALELAWDHFSKGQVDDARRWLQLSEATLKGCGCEETVAPSMLLQKAMLAEVDGRVDEALELVEQSIDALHGREHDVRKVQYRGDWGAILGRAGRMEEAKVQLEQALSECDQMLTRRHPICASVLENLATAFGALGQHEQSQAKRQEALEIYEEAVGPEHILVSQVTENLARVAFRNGDREAALQYGLRTLDIQRKHLEPDDPALANTLLLLSLIEPEQAEDRARRALAIYETSFGPNHVETADARVVLAGLLLERGNASDALEQASRALAAIEARWGDDPDKKEKAAELRARALAASAPQRTGAGDEANAHDRD